MGKRKVKSKRSLGALPKGLPVRGGSTNPFAASSSKSGGGGNLKSHKKTSLIPNFAQRQRALSRQRIQNKNAGNAFVDRRIGEYDRQMSAEDSNMARLIRERARQSQRRAKYQLRDDDDDDDNSGLASRRGSKNRSSSDSNSESVLTHKGAPLDQIDNKAYVPWNDDDDDDENGKRRSGQLDSTDTLRHFGGPGATGSAAAAANPYGPSDTAVTLSQMYLGRHAELSDWIKHRQLLKEEKHKSKQVQEDAVEKMDQDFGDLAGLLAFRKPAGSGNLGKTDAASKFQVAAKPSSKPKDVQQTKVEQEMEEWDREMKKYQFMRQRKVAATDRTKTPEEIAKEEADRLNELETRRLARMQGDIVEDDEDDTSEDDDEENNRPKKQPRTDNPEQLEDDSEDEDEDESKFIQTRFTVDGLVKIDVRTGEKVEDTVNDDKRKEIAKESPPTKPLPLLKVGRRVRACYRASEQLEGHEFWYAGVVTRVHKEGSNGEKGPLYDIEYDDGDFEDEVQPKHIKLVDGENDKTEGELEKEKKDAKVAADLERKRKAVMEKARSTIPFVFEVPTTLDVLHELIGTHARTGDDVSLIIQRIHKSNSVRLDRRNLEKMQNFYDVVMRRFVAVGDAIHTAGNGGAELGRYRQLDELTKVLYDMAQDAPDLAGAVWARRLGILQNAHGKRLRDHEFEREEDESYTTWPSTGVVLLMRVLGHVFPITDKRHYVVTPAMLLLSQYVAQNAICSTADLVLGLICCGLLLEYTKEAKRSVPEVTAFLAGVIRLFGRDEISATQLHRFPSPTIAAAVKAGLFKDFRSRVASVKISSEIPPQLSFEISAIQSDEMPTALLFSALSLSEFCIENLGGSVDGAEKELFEDIATGVVGLRGEADDCPLPMLVREKILSVATSLADVCAPRESQRTPLCRRHKTSSSIRTLAPRMEDPDRYRISKDKGKSPNQAALDRTRRELKRERKAISRELRMDAAVVEKTRVDEQQKRDSDAKARRQKAYAWLEGEQAAMNQQVAQGGGLLSGGGTGAARMKARSGNLGVKKGGKF